MNVNQLRANVLLVEHIRVFLYIREECIDEFLTFTGSIWTGERLKGAGEFGGKIAEVKRDSCSPLQKPPSWRTCHLHQGGSP